MIQLITTHKNNHEAISIMSTGYFIPRIVVSSAVSGGEPRSIVIRKGTKGFAPFGVKMLAGREAMIHIENDQIVVKNANKNIEVVDLGE